MSEKQSEKEKPTASEQQRPAKSPIREKLERMGSKEVPHPGTVRVRIFPNPRR
ncbi:MAG: hypothetical protein PVH30_04340 [Desulfobacterales bacterium]|jgi:hypothetical protein